MARQIALLRGINLGSRRRIAMADLRALLESRGHEDVRTHLQSGNVVLTSALRPKALGERLAAEIEEGLGLRVDVLVRTRDELADVIARDPLGDVAGDPRRYSVTFLSARPTAKVVRELEAADVAPERLVVSGRELYLWQPNGIQRSPLSRLVADERLGVTTTTRNWNTVTKLLALADEGR